MREIYEGDYVGDILFYHFKDKKQLSMHLFSYKDSNSSEIITDPCSYKGFMQNLTSTYLWEAPCVRGNWARDNMGGSLTGNSTGS